SNNGPVLSFNGSGGSAYIIQGVEITNANISGAGGHVPVLVDFAGNGGNITLDRVWIHPSEAVTAPTDKLRSASVGVGSWGGVNLKISNSAINGFTGFQANDQATQIYSVAILMPNSGAGPHYVVNNDLEAYRLTFSTGGATLPTTSSATVSA